MPILNTHGARVSYSRTGTGDAVLLIQGVGTSSATPWAA
jgi:hypothetical protein